MGCTYMKRGEASSRTKLGKKVPTKPKTRKRATSAAKQKAVKLKATKKRGGKKEEEVQKSSGAVKATKPEENARVDTPTVVRIKELLKRREEVRKGRPKFLRQESWRYVRIKDSWRHPKGIDSRMRKSKKGWPKLVKIGYRGPSEARGLHPSGFREVLVNTENDLENLNPETDAVRLASGLGARKRREILDRAEELGLKVLNPRGIRVIRSKE